VNEQVEFSPLHSQDVGTLQTHVRAGLSVAAAAVSAPTQSLCWRLWSEQTAGWAYSCLGRTRRWSQCNPK